MKFTKYVNLNLLCFSYMKIRGANQMGAVPPNYRCYKCHQGGHWIKDCTFGQGPVSIFLCIEPHRLIYFLLGSY